jgi:uncharacterized protein YukE
VQFLHIALEMAADSEDMKRLAITAPRAESTIDPVQELYRLDCYPPQIQAYGQQLRRAADLLASAEQDVNSARKKMRGWKGNAGRSFQNRCEKLSWACHQAQNRAGNQTTEAYRIADQLDALARQAADGSMLIAAQPPVQEACNLLAIVDDLPVDVEEQAKAVVRQALSDIQILVRVKVARIPEIGKGLDDLRTPR